MAIGQTPRKVAMFVHVLDDRAVARVVIAVAGAMQAFGADVTIVCVTQDKERMLTVPDRIRVVDLGLTGRPTSAAIPRLARYLRSSRPDVLFAHLNGPSRTAIVARALVGGRTKIVTVEHTHYGTFYSGHRWLREAATRLLFRNADLVAGTTVGVVEDLERRFPAVRGRTRVLPSVGPSPDAVSRAQLRAPDHPWYLDRGSAQLICCVANLVPRKGQDALVDALPLIRDRCGDVRLVLVGHPDAPAFVDYLRRRAATLGIAESVSIVGYQSDALPYIAHADVLALASHTEGFGMVLVEALACGVPAVATDCPTGPRAVLEGGRYGSLVQPGDVAGLSRAICQALVADTRRAELIASGRARAAAFTPDAVARAYLDAATSA